MTIFLSDSRNESINLSRLVEDVGLDDHEPDMLIRSEDKNDDVNNEKDIIKAENDKHPEELAKEDNGIVIARVDKLDNSFKEIKDVVDALTSMITSTQGCPFVPPNYPYILTPFTAPSIASPSTINSTDAIMQKLSLKPMISAQARQPGSAARTKNAKTTRTPKQAGKGKKLFNAADRVLPDMSPNGSYYIRPPAGINIRSIPRIAGFQLPRVSVCASLFIQYKCIKKNYLFCSGCQCYSSLHHI